MKSPVYDPSWNDEVKALYHHDMREMWNPDICRHIWNQYHNQIDTYISLVDEISKGQRISILDVGCAQSTLALLLAERGHDVSAIDIRSDFLKYAKSRHTHGNIEFIPANFMEIELDKEFDIVLANQIIEHLVYPERFVHRLIRVLSPQGTLIVTTPNWHYIKNSLPSFSEIGDPAKYENCQYTADADGHFFAYTAEELIAIFERANLIKMSVYFFETPFISGHMKLRYLHKLIPITVLKTLDKLTRALPWIGKASSYQLLVKGTRSG